MAPAVQHHYPAALIGQFGVPPRRSSGKRGRSRKRIVAVAHRGAAVVRLQAAETVGYLKDTPRLYDFDARVLSGITIDDLWTSVEAQLPERIRALDEASVREGHVRLSAPEFLLFLVPLIAQLLVRHPEFETRYAERVRRAWGRTEGMTRAQLNLARYVEFMSLCGVLVGLRWDVLRSPSGRFVSSDGGFAEAIARTAAGYLSGYAFPLSSRTAVFVARGGVPSWVGGESAELQIRNLNAAEVAVQNTAIASWAPSTLFGADADVVSQAMTIWGDDDHRAPGTKQVPGAILDRDFRQCDAERWLNVLHSAQAAYEGRPEPDHSVECSVCAPVRAYVRSVFGTAGASEGGNGGQGGTRR